MKKLWSISAGRSAFLRSLRNSEGLIEAPLMNEELVEDLKSLHRASRRVGGKYEVEDYGDEIRFSIRRRGRLHLIVNLQLEG